MLIGYKRGQTSIILRVKILNSSVSTGAGLTGLTNASSGLIISTIADNEASATTYTAGGSTIDSITTLGTFAAPTANHCRFKEVDATNHKGVYEIQLADARYAVSSAKSLLVSIVGATNAAETDVVIPLRDLDPYDSVRAGMTALPNAAAESAGGLYTRGSGAGQINQPANGQIDANTVKVGGTTQTARDLGASVLLSPGTGTGQISLTAGAVTVGTNNDKTGYGMTSNIKKNQALNSFEFLMTDSTNHAPATGKTVSVTRSIDGGSFAAGSLSAVTEIGNGIYAVNFAASDLNGNVITLRATATGCDDALERIVTQP